MFINTTCSYVYIWYAYESQKLYGGVALKRMSGYTYRGYKVE